MKHFARGCIVVVCMFCLTAFLSQAALAAPAKTSAAPCMWLPTPLHLVFDQNTNTVIGTLSFSSNQCGSVAASATARSFGTASGYVVHLQLRSGMTLLYEAPSGGSSASTGVQPTGGLCVFAVAVIRVPALNYWGATSTPCYT